VSSNEYKKGLHQFTFSTQDVLHRDTLKQ